MHKTIHFWNPNNKTNNLTLFAEKKIDPCRISRSTAVIWEIPQYVIYQKNVAHALFTLSTKYGILNKYHTIMPIDKKSALVQLHQADLDQTKQYAYILDIDLGQILIRSSSVSLTSIASDLHSTQVFTEPNWTT